MAKNVSAGQRRKSAQPLPGAEPGAGATPASAFDTWLNRGLHQLYDTIANEPIPEELLQIIEADRRHLSPADTDTASLGDPIAPPECPAITQAGGNDPAGET